MSAPFWTQGLSGSEKHYTRKPPSLDELKNGKILFYNNTKLGFCNYYTVFDRIKERLREIGCDDSKWVEYTETVRGKNAEKLGEYAAMLAKENPVAALVAFGDMGTSSSTTVLTIALENLGIRRRYVGTSVDRHHRGVATIAPATSASAPWTSIRAALWRKSRSGRPEWDTSRLPDLEWRKAAGAGNHRLKMDKVAPQKDGLLPFIPSFDDEKAGEPGAYMEEVMEFFNKEHISDGLPIIPPTKRRYEKMLAYCPWPEDTKLTDPSGPSGKEITVKDRPSPPSWRRTPSQPILVAAFKRSTALFNFNQSVTTSHPAEIFASSRPHPAGIAFPQTGLPGPAGVNAPIGRAINLAIMNVLRSVPGVCDLDCIASQAEFTYCFAEEPDLAQWSMINEDHFSKETTSVYVLKAEPIHDVIDFLSLDGYDLLDTITHCCTTLGSNNAYMPGPLVICLTPDHAMLLKRGRLYEADDPGAYPNLCLSRGPHGPQTAVWSPCVPPASRTVIRCPRPPASPRT
jgi:hypothetical protein